MGLLKNCRIYLAGPVELSEDNFSWRESIKVKLSKFKSIVWDPLVKPEWFISECGTLTAEEQRSGLLWLNKLHRNKHSSNFSRICINSKKALNQNKIARETCLRLVSCSDIIICYVNGPTVGTFEELCKANDEGKPILFLYSDEQIDSCWRMAQFDTAKHFFSQDKLIEYLEDINKDLTEVDNKQWIFLKGGWPNACCTTNRSN